MIDQYQISTHNEKNYKQHELKMSAFSAITVDNIIPKLTAFQIAIPSWALGTGGTRFGRFTGGGEPGNLMQKIEDVGLLHKLTRNSGSISLHLPWDRIEEIDKLKKTASEFGIHFDAVNSNTFQDHPNQSLSYKFGSLQHNDKSVRKLAINHNIEVIKEGMALGSTALTIWLADGSCFPGQLNFKKAFLNTLESLHEIYSALPTRFKMYIEYKAFEPNFYSMTVGDWGQSMLLANKLGPQAYTLVDLGHHLPNANIEQIVSLLLMEEKLGGFHFNDSKYGDDDLTAGSIRPYQLFLIFKELVEGMNAKGMDHAKDLSWMIDASHNLKDPLEDLIQSIEAIMIAYCQALLIDYKSLEKAQKDYDIVLAQEILQDAFRTDVRPLIAEARLQSGGVLNPIQLYRSLQVRSQLTQQRGSQIKATGL